MSKLGELLKELREFAVPGWKKYFEGKFPEQIEEIKKTIEGGERKTKEKSETTVREISCLVLIIIAIVIALRSGLFTPDDKTEKPPPPSTSLSIIDLQASVEFTGTQFVIMDNDNFDWMNVELKVSPGLFRGGFILKTPKIRAEKTYTARVM